MRVGDDFRIRFKSKLYELFYDMEVVQQHLVVMLFERKIMLHRDAGIKGICGSWRRALKLHTTCATCDYLRKSQKLAGRNWNLSVGK